MIRFPFSTLLQWLGPALGAAAGAMVGGWTLELAGAAFGAAAGAGAMVLVLGRVRPGMRSPGGEPAGGEPAGARDEAGATSGREGERPAGAVHHLIERLPVALLFVDRGGRVRFINEAAVNLFGRRPPGPFHVSALRAPQLLEGVETALNTRESVSVDFGLARTGGTDLHASIRLLPGTASAAENAPVALIAVEDHSQPRRAAELHRDFVANASHELKTPLASISGIIETLTGHARDDSEATERFLALMADQVERMKRLVQDLLSLNRIETNERIRPKKPQSLPQIVWEAAQSLAPMAAARDIAVTCDPPDEKPLVTGDRRDLMQLFSNLLENAIKYGTPGTEVTVRLLGRPGASRVAVAVTDHGPGIAREHLPRLTERFYRVSAGQSRARGGTGLGLAIAKHIISRHRGELQIESEIGKGSTFTVWLPVHRPEPQPAHVAADLADNTSP